MYIGTVHAPSAIRLGPCRGRITWRTNKKIIYNICIYDIRVMEVIAPCNYHKNSARAFLFTRITLFFFFFHFNPYALSNTVCISRIICTGIT